MKYITTFGTVKICTHEIKNSGTPIIFLHQLGGNAKEWNGVFTYLKKEYHLVAIDLRGHGKSSKPDTGYHIDTLGKDVKLVMDELRIRDAHFVGNELGTKVAISLAANYPERVRSIVSIGAVRNYFGKYGLFDLTNKERIETQKEEILYNLDRRILPKKDNKETLMTHMKLHIIDEGKDFNTFRHRFYEYDIMQDEEYYYTLSCPNKVIREVTKEMFEIKLETYFVRIKCPMLFLPSDEEDELTRINMTIRHFASYINPSYVRVIENTEYGDAPFDFAEEICDRLREFYDRI